MIDTSYRAKRFARSTGKEYDDLKVAADVALWKLYKEFPHPSPALQGTTVTRAMIDYCRQTTRRVDSHTVPWEDWLDPEHPFDVGILEDRIAAMQQLQALRRSAVIKDSWMAACEAVLSGESVEDYAKRVDRSPRRVRDYIHQTCCALRRHHDRSREAA